MTFGQEKTDNQDQGHDKLYRLERRLAALDEQFSIFVANKAFNTYFESKDLRCSQMLDFVHPEEIDRFKAFIRQQDVQEKSEIFRLRASTGQYRYNMVKILQNSKESLRKQNTNIEIMDIESAMETNEKALSDIAKMQLLLGVTNEYTFIYNRMNNLLCMYRYDEYQRNLVYKMDLDDWKQEMLENGCILEEDHAKFLAMIADIKAYAQSFSAKFNCSIRTRNNMMELLRFTGLLYNGGDHDKVIIGRIVPEESVGRLDSTLELADELNYDSLTNVYNKKAITEYAKRVLHEERNNRIVIVILDVDHFKSVNDTYGHLYGDKVLARVGAKLRMVVGDDGVVGRIGGDEFMIVLNGLNDDQLLRGMLRSIRTQIKWEFAEDFEDFMVTCSIGAAIYPNNGRDFEDLFKKADYCLYIAKEKGRDRYVFFRDELHRQSYEESVNKKEINAQNSGREIKELLHISTFMQKAMCDERGAIREELQRILTAYRMESINVYYGENMDRVYTVGMALSNSDNAMYAYTPEFKRLLGNRNYIQVNYMGDLTNEAPGFCAEMRRRQSFSTMQCIIGKPDDIKGIITFDRAKEAAQWADYEVSCMTIIASYLSLLASSGK